MLKRLQAESSAVVLPTLPTEEHCITVLSFAPQYCRCFTVPVGGMVSIQTFRLRVLSSAPQYCLLSDGGVVSVPVFLRLVLATMATYQRCATAVPGF